MAKSADAFRTISEVAEWLETPAHVLRFWESKFNQVKPVKRAGGRRYYRPSDMLLLGGIKKLLHSDGMTIKGVQKLLRENGVKHVAGHSPPLDDITEDEGDVVTISPTAEAPAPAAAPEPEEAKDDEPRATGPQEPCVLEEDDTSTDDADEDGADETPVMPSFAHRPRETEKASQDAAPAADASDPPAPKPMSISVPDDPADDVPAGPGVLSTIADLSAPVPDALADQLGSVLQRLRDGQAGRSAGQGR